MANVNSSHATKPDGGDTARERQVGAVEDVLALMNTLSPEDEKLIRRAHAFALEKHEGHVRLSGEPYFAHVFETARSLAELGAGPNTVAAGFLHDAIEDVGISPEEIEQKFGSEVLFLVEGVTKLGTLRYQGHQRHVESLRRLFVATSQDIRVLIIKLMDRLHNMKTLEHVRPDKQQRIARETLQVYAPIADRLGMGRLKRELEDLAFPYLYPDAYEEMRELVKERQKRWERNLEKLMRTMKKALAEHGITKFRTEHRIKGLYSLLQKLERKDRDLEKIHDIMAVRIILENVDDCYRVLGVIHGLWRPLPGKLKDYIAFPKPNGYQSIHTTVLAGPSGTIEIQIRTEAMHRDAQFGIAAHLTYKESGGRYRKDHTRANRIWFSQLIPSLLSFSWRQHQGEGDQPAAGETSAPQWIREIAESHGNEDSGSDEFIAGLRSDFFSHRIFVFTPKGDVVDLPVDSSPIDFAYAIHSDIGNHLAGAKVNDKLASLDTKLKNGDIVEIETKTSSHPSRKWLEYVKTSLARRHIQSMLQKESENRHSSH